MHIVVFPGWYPNKTDKLSGDFIQRHMMALALFCKVSVIIPIKVNTRKEEDTVTMQKGNLTEIYYYYPLLSKIKWIDNLLSFIRYNYFCIKSAVSLYKIEKIEVVQLYVLQKNHLTGLLLKILYKIPYVISEQSTFYIDGRFDKKSLLQKSIFRFVFKQSASYHAVSKFLSSTLQKKLGLTTCPVVIPNVVDSDIFFYKNNLRNDRVIFVHVSNFTYQKNVNGMLAAFAEVKKVNSNFQLNLVGPLPPSVNSKLNTLGLLQNVVCWNERNYQQVAQIMQQSDTFVFFTRYETFGCVIIEANACGLPVIASDLEVIHELVSDKFNGLFVQNENEKDLADKILFIMNNRDQFDPAAISVETRNKFNYERIGRIFYDWFRLVKKEYKA